MKEAKRARRRREEQNRKIQARHRVESHNLVRTEITDRYIGRLSRTPTPCRSNEWSREINPSDH